MDRRDILFPRLAYPVAALRAGSSLGNRWSFARFDRETNLLGLWSSSDNRYYAGKWEIRFHAGNTPLSPGETTFDPLSQSTEFTGAGWTVRKKCFLPYDHGEEALSRCDELRAVIVMLEIRNGSGQEGDLTIDHDMHFPAVATDLFLKQPPREDMERGVTIVGHGSVFEATFAGEDGGACLFGSSPPPGSSVSDERSLRAGWCVKLAPGEERIVPFVLVYSPEGAEKAERAFARLLDAAGEELRSMERLREVLSRSLVMSPDSAVNRSLQWAKTNTLRVQHRYLLGDAFTNDPPQDIVVIRDLGWYVFGSDYLTPDFSRNLLEFGARYGYHDGGKLTEYVHACDEGAALHDYGLNINDDTPLFVLALWHHAAVCRDDYGFDRAWPLMKRAADWIIAQIDRGLVRCSADGTSVTGICGWRNIIEGYTLSGAVTEVNAECVHALRLTATVAEILHHDNDAAAYAAHASHLKSRITTDLQSDVTGMYLLNIGTDGVRHHDVTGDLIFPVLFDVADAAGKKKILEVLTGPDMWTPYGSRTVSPHENNYDPDFGYQLVGGVWHNLTAWIAWCVRDERPDLLVEGMRNISRLVETACPADFVHVVPGEFPERMHGETFVSRGMTMSPWMPPTLLWLAVEGLMGFRPEPGVPGMQPCLPPGWKWLAVKNLPFRGATVDAFLHNGTLYSTTQVLSAFPLSLGTSIPSESDNPAIFTVGMRCGKDFFLFAACDTDAAGSVSMRSGPHRFAENVRLKAGECTLFTFNDNH